MRCCAATDGFVDLEELKAMFGKDAEQMMAEVDQDGDGRVSYEEFCDVWGERLIEKAVFG